MGEEEGGERPGLDDGGERVRCQEKKKSRDSGGTRTEGQKFPVCVLLRVFLSVPVQLRFPSISVFQSRCHNVCPPLFAVASSACLGFTLL